MWIWFDQKRMVQWPSDLWCKAMAAWVHGKTMHPRVRDSTGLINGFQASFPLISSILPLSILFLTWKPSLSLLFLSTAPISLCSFLHSFFIFFHDFLSSPKSYSFYFLIFSTCFFSLFSQMQANNKCILKHRSSKITRNHLLFWSRFDDCDGFVLLRLRVDVREIVCGFVYGSGWCLWLVRRVRLPSGALRPCTQVRLKGCCVWLRLVRCWEWLVRFVEFGCDSDWLLWWGIGRLKSMRVRVMCLCLLVYVTTGSKRKIHLRVVFFDAGSRLLWKCESHLQVLKKMV